MFALLLAFLAGFVAGRLTGATQPRARQAARSKPDPASLEETAARLSVESREEIKALLAQGRKIEAIRECRSALGLGLKEAKDLVDFIEGNEGTGARAR